MEVMGVFKQACNWLLSQKHILLGTTTAICCLKDKIVSLFVHHWPYVYNGCLILGKLLLLLLLQWRECVVRGSRSLLNSGPTALFVVLWSCFLSLTSMTCVVYVLLILGAAGAVVPYLGYTPGLFLAGLFGILFLWMYGIFWITALLFIVGGYFFCLNHARLPILISTIYAIFCVNVHVGWHGVFLSINLAFLSNDLFSYLLQVYDVVGESTKIEESTESESVSEDFSGDSQYSSPASESEKSSCKTSSKTIASHFVSTEKDSFASKVLKADSSSMDEVKRILNSLDYYEALGIPRNKNIDVEQLRKEYRKKAMLVHPDKNMGSPLAGESFKKLQSAYEVLSDFMKKKDYDEQLRKEASRTVCQRSHGTSKQDGVGYCAEESRCIHCTKCGNSHIWICTNRTKVKARWCQDCCQFHPAKDGDGWVEKTTQKVEIPRAFVCAESKIFDVSEWAICQGMSCRPNSHRPSFNVNMVGLDKSSQRSNAGRYPWGLDAEMTVEADDFDVWLQQAVNSGLFSDSSSKHRWSGFKLQNKKGKKYGRRLL